MIQKIFASYWFFFSKMPMSKNPLVLKQTNTQTYFRHQSVGPFEKQENKNGKD